MVYHPEWSYCKEQSYRSAAVCHNIQALAGILKFLQINWGRLGWQRQSRPGRPPVPFARKNSDDNNDMLIWYCSQTQVKKTTKRKKTLNTKKQTVIDNDLFISLCMEHM